jgi:beta-phosphoglucomutase
MIRGLFFDLDGTLVDTHQANYEAYRKAIAEVSGNELSLDEFKRGIGHSAKEFLPWFAPGLSEAEYDQIVSRKRECYKDLMHLTRLNVELVNFMRSLTNTQRVLVTSAKRRNAQIVLEHHGLKDAFSYIIAGDDVERAKPDPEGYLMALQKTGLQPTEALAFEDSEVGRSAAESAGLHVLMIDVFAL